MRREKILEENQFLKPFFINFLFCVGAAAVAFIGAAAVEDAVGETEPVPNWPTCVT